MQIIRGDGRLRHRFHGDYSAVIVLKFATPTHAERARTVLGSDLWQIPPDFNTAIVWTGNSDALACMKLKLAQVGADADKIDSLRTSIDYGEPFTVAIPVL
jgi:hypothetical protein